MNALINRHDAMVDKGSRLTARRFINTVCKVVISVKCINNIILYSMAFPRCKLTGSWEGLSPRYFASPLAYLISAPARDIVRDGVLEDCPRPRSQKNRGLGLDDDKAWPWPQHLVLDTLALIHSLLLCAHSAKVV